MVMQVSDPTLRKNNHQWRRRGHDLPHSTSLELHFPDRNMPMEDSSLEISASATRTIPDHDSLGVYVFEHSLDPMKLFPCLLACCCNVSGGSAAGAWEAPVLSFSKTIR